jgi:hypothetical protein
LCVCSFVDDLAAAAVNAARRIAWAQIEARHGAAPGVRIAPPGAGKGTQGALIAAHFDIPHIATGFG